MMDLTPHDALLVVDVQQDFLPGGALGIEGGDAIVPILRRYVAYFHEHGRPIFVTRDWHPPDHCSFREQGGPWPVHCVAGTPGSLPPDEFQLPESAVIIYKAIDRDKEAYSTLQDTPLHRHLRALNISRLFIGGLATDYCVLNTVKDARALGYDVCLLMDAIKPVNRQPDDGQRSETEMLALGALPVRVESLAA
jgi:nicotinamidase/pyrazinamidase